MYKNCSRIFLRGGGDSNHRNIHFTMERTNTVVNLILVLVVSTVLCLLAAFICESENDRNSARCFSVITGVLVAVQVILLILKYFEIW